MLEILGDIIDEHSSDDYLARLRLSKIGFVFQTFNLLATMSAFENVELPMAILGKLSKSERTKRAKHLLKCKFDILNFLLLLLILLDSGWITRQRSSFTI